MKFCQDSANYAAGFVITPDANNIGKGSAGFGAFHQDGVFPISMSQDPSGEFTHQGEGEPECIWHRRASSHSQQRRSSLVIQVGVDSRRASEVHSQRYFRLQGAHAARARSRRASVRFSFAAIAPSISACLRRRVLNTGGLPSAINCVGGRQAATRELVRLLPNTAIP